MRLSEAIMLGSTLSAQAFGCASRGDARCALSAACDALGKTYLDADGGFVFWPWLDRMTTCPECARVRTIGEVVASCLNDKHQWSRERIAEWVASVEPAEMSKSAELSVFIADVVKR